MYLCLTWTRPRYGPKSFLRDRVPTQTGVPSIVLVLGEEVSSSVCTRDMDGCLSLGVGVETRIQSDLKHFSPLIRDLSYPHWIPRVRVDFSGKLGLLFSHFP